MTASTAKHRTVIEHVLSRLHAISISEVFGVPGDYAFPVQDAIVNFPGIEWVARVTTCGELDQALRAVEKGGSAAYIEVVTDAYAASPLAKRLHERVKTLYSRS
jgi:thiamine pyrophosphate-dependent acetolactate synthase large subunit-like protein